MFTPKVILAGCCLPYAGFLFGAVISTVFQQPGKRIVTIALETGIQNVGVPILVMQSSLPHPEVEIAMIGPLAVAIATPIPLWIGLIVQEVHRRCCRRAQQDVTSDHDGTELPCAKKAEADAKDIEASEDLLAKKKISHND